jgi:hypothetical protein
MGMSGTIVLPKIKYKKKRHKKTQAHAEGIKLKLRPVR